MKFTVTSLCSKFSFTRRKTILVAAIVCATLLAVSCCFMESSARRRLGAKETYFSPKCCFVGTRNKTGHVTESCGKFAGVTQPGFHCIGFPNPFMCAVGELSLALQELAVKSSTKTVDNVVVGLESHIQYQVNEKDMEDAFYHFNDPEKQIETYVQTRIEAELPKMTVDELYRMKTELEDKITADLEIQMKQFGFEIKKTCITQITLPKEVQKAMTSIQSANYKKQSELIEAEAARKVKIIDAKGDAEAVKLHAEAAAEAEKLQGEGLAQKRKAVLSQLEKDLQSFTDRFPNLSKEEILDFLIKERHLETLGKMDGQTILMNHDPTGDSITQRMVQNRISGGDTILESIIAFGGSRSFPIFAPSRGGFWFIWGTILALCGCWWFCKRDPKLEHKNLEPCLELDVPEIVIDKHLDDKAASEANSRRNSERASYSVPPHPASPRSSPPLASPRSKHVLEHRDSDVMKTVERLGKSVRIKDERDVQQLSN